MNNRLQIWINSGREPYEPYRSLVTCKYHFLYPGGMESMHYDSMYECRLAAEAAKASETSMRESTAAAVRAAFDHLKS